MTTTGNSEYAVDVHNLNKSFGDKHVVKNVSMQVRKGEILGFLGPNGSGKTTTIRLMCGLLKADSGSGSCLGYDIQTESDTIKRNVGYMTQRFSFWEDLTIAENLDFVARMYAVPKRRQVVEQAIVALGLAARSRQLAGELSGGWKQRMALAACMLHGPRLLLLDEPTAGVDPKGRRDFWDELQDFAARGISVLVSTHYMDEASRCHTLAYIAEGKLLAQGSASEIIASQSLNTWAIHGGGLIELQEPLRFQPGVDQTVIFGDGLHVSGTDASALEEAVRRIAAQKSLHAEKIDTGLEDVFIYMMSRSADNSAGQS
jgi:ABC-2 type transport system ATP-binding protein